MALDNPELISGGGVPDRLGFHKKSGALRKEMEAVMKARLQMQRQSIRAEMQSYKLPNMQTVGYESDEQLDEMQGAHDEEFLKQLQTPEFLRAARDKVSGGNNRQKAKLNKRKTDRAKKGAQKAANKTVEEMAQVGKAASGAGKMGHDTANVLSLFDALNSADLEIPTIFAIMVQMYRATTAILNNGQKFIKGFLSFIEPAPLFRFWSITDAKKAANESTADPLLGGGTELENIIESIVLGWPEAFIGWFVVLLFLLCIIAIMTFILMIILLAASPLLIITSGL